MKYRPPYCLIFGLVFLLCNPSLKAQTPAKPLPDDPLLKERLIYGGSFWITFGTFTDIELMPLIGLRQTNRLAHLAGPIYSYFGIRSQNFGSHGYGGRALSRFFITDRIYMQAEVNNLTYRFLDNNQTFTSNDFFTMAGLGLYSHGSTVELLYILNNSINDRYTRPYLFRVGFIID